MQDICYFKLLPKRYKTTQGKDAKYWSRVSREYGNFKKSVDCTDYHWYVITFKDGRKELAYFRIWRIVIPHGGRLCRGIIFPRYWSPMQYEHVKEIRLAF